jgi:hypothetical protein
MRTHFGRWAGGAALLAALVVLATQGLAGGGKESPWKAILPGDSYKELVARAQKTLAEKLATKPDDEAIKPAQVAAALIAAYNLSSKEGNKAQADAALKLAELLKSPKNYAQAKKLADDLIAGKTTGGGAAGTDMNTIVEDLGDIMVYFKTKMKGGEGLPEVLQSTPPLKGTLNGVEAKIASLRKRELTKDKLAKERDEIILMAYKTAVIGSMAHSYAPARKVGQKDPAVWRELSIQMRDGGAAVAEAARKSDPAALLKAADRLESSCTACHSVFRP